MSKLFWNKEYLRADSLKVLLANIKTRREGLRQELPNLLNIKSSLIYAILWSLIVACSKSLVESSLHRFCHMSTSIN